jgi:hypothetical protein
MAPMSPLTRDQLKTMSREFESEAHLLHSAGRWHGSYYLAGYALELALKARICRHLAIADYPSEQYFLTHDLTRLRLLAGLAGQFATPQLAANWSTAAGWKPDVRYWPIGAITEQLASDMLGALTKGTEGLLPWLRRRW